MLPAELVPFAAAALAFCCVAGLVVSLFHSQITGRSEINKRLAEIASNDFTSDRIASSEDAKRRKAVEAKLKEQEEKQKARKGSKPTLSGRLKQAGLEWSRVHYYTASAAAALLSFLLAIITVPTSPIPAIGFAVTGGLLLPHLYVGIRRAKRMKSFSDEFPNAVDIIVRGIKSGLPLADCLRIISLEAREPVRGEFRSVIEDQTMGLPMDQAVQKLPERIPLAEANFFAIVIAMQSRTGGSLSEALSNLSKVLRERKKMQGKIKAASSEAKASAGIIGSLPVGVTLLLYLTTPDYIALLFTTYVGNLVLGVCAFWMLVGTLVMRKMINFDF